MKGMNLHGTGLQVHNLPNYDREMLDMANKFVSELLPPSKFNCTWNGDDLIIIRKS